MTAHVILLKLHAPSVLTDLMTTCHILVAAWRSVLTDLIATCAILL